MIPYVPVFFLTYALLDRFALFVPLHQLWMGYMSELLGLDVPDGASSHEDKMPSASSMHAKLVKADLNGALLTGRRDKPPLEVAH